MAKQIEILTFHPSDDIDLTSLTLDIIALHGLNGNQLTTWTDPKTQALWLRDFLPKDVKARVMLFGYDAKAAFGDGIAGVKEHARGLLGALGEKRGRSFEAKRPLIFVGHSLGGLVIKQALVIAEQETLYKQIYNSTLGIIFFGTPHQGSRLANYATAITSPLLVLANKPDAELLEFLKKDNPALKQLGDEWKAHHEKRPYDVVSFYETKTMRGLKCLIVEKSSALLTPSGEIPTYEEQIPVAADHREICRFAMPKDKTYRMAVRSIKRIHQGSQLNVTNEFYVVPHSASSLFTGRDDIREQLDESLLPYRNSKTQQRFVLHGLGGSGKTQIALKFAEDNRHRFWGIFWIDASSEDKAQEGFLKCARVCRREEDMDAFKAWLSQKDHWLLILDNADNPDLDVSKFFPARDRGTILITTRNRDLRKHQTAGTYCADQLPPKDAINLLLKTAAIEDLEGEEARKVAEGIVKELGYLALAIIQAGAVIRQGICSLDGFCDLYSKQKREVLESGRTTSQTEVYEFSVFTTWEISIQKIQETPGDHAKLALELLKIFSFMHFDNIQTDLFESSFKNSKYATDIPEFGASLLPNLMPEGWNGLLWGKALKLLLGFSLITTSHSDLISMHPLVHLWSRERLSAPERAAAWKTAFVTLSMSTTGDLADEQNRRMLLPHLDSLFGQDDGHFAVPVLQDIWGGYRALSHCHLAYTEGGQFQKALKMVQADLKSKERILDTKDEVYLSLNFLVGYDLQRLGRYRDSVKKLESVLKDLPERPLTNIALQTAIGIGGSYNYLREYQTAFELCTETMAKHEELLTHEPYGCVLLYNIMGVALSGLRRPKEATVWARKELQGAQKLYGPGNSRTSKAMGSLAANYADLKDIQKACYWQEKGIRSLTDSLGNNHPDTIDAEERLMNHIALHKIDPLARKGIIGLRKAHLEKLSQHFGDKDWRTLQCRAWLAQDYFLSGSLKKAMRIQEELVDTMEREFGEDDERIIEGVSALARTRRWTKIRRAVYWWIPQSFLK